VLGRAVIVAARQDRGRLIGRMPAIKLDVDQRTCFGAEIRKQINP
jgi:hypothetical protein